MGFSYYISDLDVWIRLGTKANVTEYWEYVLLYTDDNLAVMEEPNSFNQEEFGKRFNLKENSISPPTQYLGNKVSKVTMANVTKCWSSSSSQYVQSAVTNAEDYLHKRGEKLPKTK